LPQGITIIPFIQAQSFRTAPPFADSDAINRFQDFDLIMPIRLAQSEVQRIPPRVDHQVALEAANTVLSGISDLVFRPLFDLITLASW